MSHVCDAFACPRVRRGSALIACESLVRIYRTTLGGVVAAEAAVRRRRPDAPEHRGRRLGDVLRPGNG